MNYCRKWESKNGRMDASKELLIVGELNVDLLLNGLHGFPEMGKEIVAETAALVLGSSSAIMAANSAALGINTTFCGFVGNDIYGNLVLERLKQKNVDIRFVKKTEDQGTGITVVMNYGQDRANVTYCGAMDAMTLQDIPWTELKKYRHLHISSVFLQKKLGKDIVAIFEKAKALHLTTSLDLQWDPAEAWNFDYKSCLPYVDVFLPNKQELMALTGTSNMEQGIDTIRPFANCITVKLGQEGCIAINGKEKIKVSAFRTPQYIDAIGAGDSFNSGFIKKYLENAPLEECLRHGNLMGALNTTAAGGTGAFVDKTAIDRKTKAILELNLDR